LLVNVRARRLEALDYFSMLPELGASITLEAFAGGTRRVLAAFSFDAFSRICALDEGRIKYEDLGIGALKKVA
jgi:hypothetical protein